MQICSLPIFIHNWDLGLGFRFWYKTVNPKPLSIQTRLNNQWRVCLFDCGVQDIATGRCRFWRQDQTRDPTREMSATLEILKHSVSPAQRLQVDAWVDARVISGMMESTIAIERWFLRGKAHTHSAPLDQHVLDRLRALARVQVRFVEEWDFKVELKCCIHRYRAHNR